MSFVYWGLDAVGPLADQENKKFSQTPIVRTNDLTMLEILLEVFFVNQESLSKYEERVIKRTIVFQSRALS